MFELGLPYQSKSIIVAVITAKGKHPRDALWEGGRPHRFGSITCFIVNMFQMKCVLLGVTQDLLLYTT